MTTRKFNIAEQSIIKRLAITPTGDALDFSKWLGDFYFTEQTGRALVFQNAARYAVFYLRPEVFTDEQRKKQEIARLLEFTAFIRYLINGQYLYLYAHEDPKVESLICLHNSFNNPRRSGNRLLLNDTGDYTDVPKTILNKQNEVIYEGIMFTGEVYNVLSSTLTGSLYVANSLRDLMRTDFQPQNPTQASKKALSFHWTARTGFLAATVTGLLVAIGLGLAFMPGRSHFSDAKESPQSPAPVAVTNRTQVNTCYGIDISRYNGNIADDIDPTDSISFVFCKATEGDNHVDTDFEKNWIVAGQKGFARGAYHFYKVGDDPDKQVRNFMSVIERFDTPDLPPAVDIEYASIYYGVPDAATLQQDLLSMLNKLEEESGKTPMIYTNYAFADHYLLDPEFQRFPLWLADYSSNNHPVVPQTWRAEGVKIWQKSDHYTIASSPSDFDVLYGKISDLSR